MGHATSRHKSINPELLKPQGLYSNTKDIDLKRLKRHILERKIAPCFRGSDSDINQAYEECCICMLYYPALNRTKCCCKGLCTECFLQIKSGTGCRTNAPCPFCKEALMVVYKGPRSAEETQKAKEDEQAVIEAQLRARKSEQQLGEEMARQRATASHRPRQAAGLSPAAASFLTSTSAPSVLPSQGLGAEEQDRSAPRQTPPRTSLSLARRQARTLDAKLSQYVPEDILQGVESPGSEHMDLNDLMLMHAVYASLQGAPSGLNERTRSGPEPTPGADAAGPQSQDSVHAPNASENSSADDSQHPTQFRMSLGEAPLPLESVASSSAGSLEDGTSRSSVWSTAGVGNADSVAPSGYAASESSLLLETLETAADGPRASTAASAISSDEMEGSRNDAPGDDLIPAIRARLHAETAEGNPKLGPESKAGLDRFDIACSPSTEGFPGAAKPTSGLIGGGQDALAPLVGGAAAKPVLANMLARLVGKTAASAVPTSSGSGESDPPSQSALPGPANQVFIGMVLAPQAAVGLPGFADGSGARAHSGLVATPADLAVMSLAWDAAGMGHQSDMQAAGGAEGAQAVSSGADGQGIDPADFDDIQMAGPAELSRPQEAASQGARMVGDEAGQGCTCPADAGVCICGHTLDERGGPVVLQNPDGTEQLVLLTNDALAPSPEPVQEAYPTEATYSAPSGPMDAAIVAAIRRGDELLQQVYSSSSAPACSPSEEQGGQPGSDSSAATTSATAASADDWLARARAADEALTRAINSRDVAVAAAASR